jgi:hypothetical protein
LAEQHSHAASAFAAQHEVPAFALQQQLSAFALFAFSFAEEATL